MTLRGPSYTKSRPVYFTEVPKLIRSQLDSVTSLVSTKEAGGVLTLTSSHSSITGHQDIDRDGRDEGCREGVWGAPLWHTVENKYHHLLHLSLATPLSGI
jgi:hypothetical protein